MMGRGSRRPVGVGHRSFEGGVTPPLRALDLRFTGFCVGAGLPRPEAPVTSLPTARRDENERASSPPLAVDLQAETLEVDVLTLFRLADATAIQAQA